MHTFKTTAAQGDVYIRRVDTIPAGLTAQGPTGDRHIIAHSETGHHHWMDAGQVRRYVKDEYVSYLDVRAPTPIIHDRPVDGHDPILFAPGLYEIQRQRECTPEGYRRLED